MCRLLCTKTQRRNTRNKFCEPRARSDTAILDVNEQISEEIWVRSYIFIVQMSAANTDRTFDRTGHNRDTTATTGHRWETDLCATEKQFLYTCAEFHTFPLPYQLRQFRGHKQLKIASLFWVKIDFVAPCSQNCHFALCMAKYTITDHRFQDYRHVTETICHQKLYTRRKQTSYCLVSGVLQKCSDQTFEHMLGIFSTSIWYFLISQCSSKSML